MTEQEKTLVIDNLDLVRNTIVGVISRNESVQGMGYDDLFLISGKCYIVIVQYLPAFQYQAVTAVF